MARPPAPTSPYALLADLADAAARGATAAALTRSVAACLGRHLPLRAVELAWVHPAGDAVEVVHARLGEGTIPLATERRPRSATAGKVAIERGELVLARTSGDGAAGAGPAERAVAEHVQAGWFLVVPLVAEQGASGFAVLYLAAEPQRRPVIDEELVLAVGRVLAGAQQRVRAIARVASTCRVQSLRLGARARWDRHAAPPPPLVAESPAMRRLAARLGEIGRGGQPVFIHGPSGSGRGTVARAVHGASARHGAFVPIRGGAREVAALLFGREFPRRRGLVELADGGTLFISDVDQLPRPVQGALVALIESGRCARVGATTAYGVDCRVVVSSRHDLHTLALAGRFEPDLAALLEGQKLRVPPLSERSADVPGLTDAILGRLADRLGMRAPRPTIELLGRLAQARFAGEVRGLTNALERALLEAPADTHILGAEQVFPPPEVVEVPVEVRVEVPVEVRVEVPVPVEVRVEVPVEVPVEVRVEVPVPVEVRVEVPVAVPTPVATDRSPAAPVGYDEGVRDVLARALRAAEGRIYGAGGAAELLGLQPSTLQSKMQKLGLVRSDFERKPGPVA